MKCLMGQWRSLFEDVKTREIYVKFFRILRGSRNIFTSILLSISTQNITFLKSLEQSGKMLALRELLIECQIGDRRAAVDGGNMGNTTGAETTTGAATNKGVGGRGRRKSVDQQQLAKPQKPQNACTTTGGDVSSGTESGSSSSCSSPFEAKCWFGIILLSNL